MLNLPANAVQVIEKEGLISIYAKQLTETRESVIEIHDSGIGGAPEAIPKVFEPLYTTRATVIGLGLSICKQIIESHKGELDLTSQLGLGAILRQPGAVLWLPQDAPSGKWKSHMQYKQIVHKDAGRHESIWLCTSHSHELLVQSPYAPNYLMTTHISQDYSFPLLVLFSGKARWFAGQRLRFVSQPGMFGIEYVRSGNAIVRKGKEEILVQPGEVYFLGNDFPAEYMTGPAGSLSKRYVMLTGPAHENLLRLMDLWGRKTLTLQQPQKFEALLRQMTRLLAQGPPDVGMRSSALAYQILLVLSQSIQPSIPRLLERALAFMQQNLQRQLTLHDLCAHLGVNEAYLGRRFAQYLKISPIKYFLKQKLSWSANMLCTTSLTIKEIAYRAGYEDPFYFSKQFKQQFGISPRQYRKTHAVSMHED